MIDRYALFSTHARDRLKESGISIAKASWYLYNAEREKLPSNLRKAKYEKYGDDEQHIYRYGTFVFVLRQIQDKFTGDDCYLVLTVTDQNITFAVPKGRYYQRKTSHNHV